VTGPEKSRRATIRAMAQLWQFETNSPPIQADPDWEDTPLGEQIRRDEAVSKWRGTDGQSDLNETNAEELRKAHEAIVAANHHPASRRG